jgi:hypothetical protein
MPDIIAEVVSSADIPEGNVVTIRTEKLSPVPSSIMVEERARARAIVEAGIADTVSSVFTDGVDISRRTSVKSFRTIDADYPEKMEFEIEVKQ